MEPVIHDTLAERPLRVGWRHAVMLKSDGSKPSGPATGSAVVISQHSLLPP